MQYYASIETGGTKCICTVGTSVDNLHVPYIIDTTNPKETLEKIIEYFKTKIHTYTIQSMGIASFGPIDLNKNSKTYGYITSTPKLQWDHTDFVGTIQRAFPTLAIAFDTDVNSAALAEGACGAAFVPNSAQTLDNFVYITVGTGIGIGVIVHGKPVHGILHPEGGHMILPLHPKDPSEGFCPYHKNCLEGLAAGPTFDKRWHMPAKDIDDSHIAWELEAYYLASGIVNIITMLSPQKIIIGGGISKRATLFPKIRSQVLEILNNYIQVYPLLTDIDNYIVPASLENSGLLGGIIMAKNLNS